jgi:hypothetical protein
MRISERLCSQVAAKVQRGAEVCALCAILPYVRSMVLAGRMPQAKSLKFGLYPRLL